MSADKMDFGRFFGTDEKREEEGAWIDFTTTLRFCLRSMASPTVKRAIRRTMRPIRNVINMPGIAADQAAQKAMIETVATAGLVNWQGVVVDGEEVPFSAEAARKLFERYPRALSWVWEQMQNMEAFQAEEVEEAGKVSES